MLMMLTCGRGEEEEFFPSPPPPPATPPAPERGVSVEVLRVEFIVAEVVLLLLVLVLLGVRIRFAVHVVLGHRLVHSHNVDNAG